MCGSQDACHRAIACTLLVLFWETDTTLGAISSPQANAAQLSVHGQLDLLPTRFTPCPRIYQILLPCLAVAAYSEGRSALDLLD